MPFSLVSRARALFSLRPMTITINGETRELDAPSSVAELLAVLGLGDKPVVVELDREAVLPADHATTTVEAGARVEIVTLAAGG